MAISNFVFGVICFAIFFTLKVQAATLTFKSSEPETTYLEYGRTLNLNVSYQYDGNHGVGVTWSFNGDPKIRAVDGGNPIFNKDPLRAKIVGLASFQLVNTNFSDNGTFTVSASTFDVTNAIKPLNFEVIIQVRPVANISCTTPVNLNEGGNFSCICSGVSGSPPPTAYWLKDNNSIPIAKGYVSALLDIRNVSKNDNGTYICRVQSGTLIDQKEVDITVFAATLTLKSSEPKTTYLEYGRTLNLNVSYQYDGNQAVPVTWSINGHHKIRAIDGGKPIINTDPLRAKIVGLASLQVVNTNFSDNGTFSVSANPLDATNVIKTLNFEVIIQVQPVANISCATPVNITEGENLSCICSGVGGSPPATAYWLKDSNSIPIAKGYLSALLDKRNVSKNDNGTYVCRVQSGNLIDEQRVNVKLLHGPTFINFKSNVTNSIAQVGDYVKLTCLADGNPKPSYNITFVRIQPFEEILTSIEGILIINNVNISDDGTYRCVAKNNFGSKEAELFLNVTAKTTQSTTTAPTTVLASSTKKTPANSSMTSPVPPTTTVFFSTEKAISDKNNGGTEWYIVVITLFCGIAIGIIFSFTVLWLYRRRKEKRDHPKSSQARRVSETHDNPSVYQELDLQRMNNEDSYQSLRKTSRPANRQEPTAEAAESGYQELDKVRGSNDDNNYQSLNRV